MEKIIKKAQYNSQYNPQVVELATKKINQETSSVSKFDAMQKLRDSGMSTAEIAKVFNCSRSWVHRNTVGNPELTRAQRLKTAAHGRAVKALANRLRFAYYSEIMLELRKQGFNNADIAKKTGFHYATVRKYIGKQPDETTLASMRTAGAKRRFRNLAVRNQIARDEGKPIPSVEKYIKPTIAETEKAI